MSALRSMASAVVVACAQGDCAEYPTPAAYLFPQIAGDGFTYVPVCTGHASDWWDDGAPGRVTHYRLTPIDYPEENT